MQQKNAKIAPGPPKEEYSWELGSQNYSKMELKMEPKVIQKQSLPKNMKNTVFAAIYYT